MPIYEYTGELQFFTVPSNVCAVRIRAVGARGGNVLNFTGGLGAEVIGTFPVTPGETLTVLVGGAGIDSNVGNSAGGGGGSFVWRGNGFLDLAANPMGNLLIAAGGGGGAAVQPSVNNGNNGGNGQTGTIGESGKNAPNDGGSGGGGGNNVTGGFAGSGGGGGTAGSPGGNGFGAGGGGGGGSIFDGGGGGGGGISGSGGSGGNNSSGNVHGGAGGFSIIVGGAGGIGGIGTTINGTNGGFGGGGGGGGGGEFPPAGGGGGGGGGGALGFFPPPAGGGGGSSFIHPSAINTFAASGVGTGNGIVEINLLTSCSAGDFEKSECIRVAKVYDWTLSQTQEQREISPPPECEQAIANAIAAGQIVNVTCNVPPIDLTNFILVSNLTNHCPVDEIYCLEIGREDVTLVDGTQAQLVAMVSNIPLHFVVSANGTVICEFDTHVKIFQKEIICAPQGTRILCRVTQIVCDAVLLNECQIVVNVSICKEILVETDVKLEIIANFCRPRAPISSDILSLPCPPVGQFPQQCPSIFPTEQCNCSISGVASGEFYVPILFELLGLNILSTTLNINICPDCQATGSTLVGSLTVATVLGISVLTIPLEATSINPPMCNFPAQGIYTVNGALTLAADGLIGLSLPYTLIINTNTNVVTLTIDILDVPLTLTPLSVNGLKIIECDD